MGGWEDGSVGVWECGCMGVWEERTRTTHTPILPHPHTQSRSNPLPYPSRNSRHSGWRIAEMKRGKEMKGT